MSKEYRNPAYEATYDLPHYEEVPTRTYMVATTPRSGSSLFAFLCRQTGVLGFPLEYFTQVNREIIERRQGVNAQSMSAYVPALTAIRTSANGVFGFKLHFSELESFRSAGGFHMSVFGTLRVVVLERSDKLAQAISLQIASQTNEWIGLRGFQMRGSKTPDYDREAISQIVATLEDQHRKWAAFLANGGYPILRLTYEHLLQDCSGVFRRVADFLEVPSREPNLASVDIQQQGDALNREWMRKFLSGE